MKAKTIIKNIMESTLTREEVSTIWSALKRKSDMRRQVAVLDFTPGEYVKFTSKKGHGRVHGIVTKLNRKTVGLDASDGVHWRVTPEYLERSTEEEYNSAPQGRGLREHGGIRR